MSTPVTTEKMNNEVSVEETKPVANRRVVQPLVDIIEREEAIELVADMPGVSAESVDVTLERNVLTLHGIASARNRTYQRAFTLSRRIDRDKIDALVQNGVLMLTLGLAAEVVPQRRQIAIQAG